MSNQQRLNVLVVDRDEETTMQLKEVLTGEGYVVQSLSDPGQAGEEVRSGRYQLVILDVSPDNPAGIDALQQIRSVDDDLCVIATTGLPRSRWRWPR